MKLLLAALALAGCSYGPPPESTPPPEGQCNAAPAQGLVGRPSSEALAEEAMELSGARVWRWLRPGQIVTMEFRADRLNIRLDARDRVEGIACG
jgi:hypothetical protein